MPSIPDKSIDMILCDLPYGTTQNKWDIVIPFEPLWEQYKRVIKDNGVVALFGCEPFSSYLRLSNINWYKYDWIWEKSHARGFLNAWKQPLRKTENISVFYKEQCLYKPILTNKPIESIRPVSLGGDTDNYGEYKIDKDYRKIPRDKSMPVNILKFDIEQRYEHPTQKPIELIKYFILTYTNESDTILDNCSGSGTTAEACEETNRQYICIEKNMDYYTGSLKRIKNYKAQINLFKV
jgi:site-specific DNA-methyltransferase (adenine-specific)